MFIFLEYLLIAVYIEVLLVVSHWIGQQAHSWMPLEATAEAQKVDSLFSFLVSIGAFILLGLVNMTRGVSTGGIHAALYCQRGGFLPIRTEGYQQSLARYRARMDHFLTTPKRKL